MSGLDKNRIRNQTVCFRATAEERRQIEARIAVSGMPKGQFYIQSLLHQELNIVVGKYQSDRLSLEIRRLRERLDEIPQQDKDALYEPLTECKALLTELVDLMKKSETETTVTIEDILTEK
ncbi:plasmid mobilization protein [Acetivibrio ethanolgignens]|uniref:Mobilization protein n=1 Tax=Acetivibrio ethanolgignens TaxID=290052 RepID=A0A0V8QI40_9FIRM|nr:hypothetical protein [Acetivibrio ethanolgignens]KSV60232.1 hypothetical protein ASU35_17235 [Acetivibrio ethanolgignens]